MTQAVEVRDLVVRYGDITAVDELSFEAMAGQVTALVGPNGAGKTSTVETCEGYVKPTSGTVRVLGLDPIEDARALHQRIGVMLQSGGVPSGSKAVDALAHMARMYANPLNVPALAERLGLTSIRSTYRRMSGGEQQRLKFAIALVGRPELVFLDEPTGGLDGEGKREVWQIVDELRDAGVSIVLTTHLMDDVERLADNVVVITGGALVISGTPAELVSASEAAITFAAKAGLDLAGLAAQLPNTATVREVPAGTYCITGDTGADVLAIVTAWCAEERINARNLSSGPRRLEDVIIELTSGKATV